ncbi:MAG: hypothetical protein QXG63_03885, partial [Nitrososphaerales archaeon]
FLEEIALHRSKAPRNNLTGNFHLRMILDSIAQKYDPQNMTAYSVRVNNFEGRPFSSDEDLNKIIIEMLLSDYPQIFSKYLDYKIKTRPKDTELVVYVDWGIKDVYEVFYNNGFSEFREEESKKSKLERVIGRSALTKEQAESDT